MTFSRIVFVCFLLSLTSVAHAASGDAIVVSDWQTSGNPFVKSQSLDGLSITNSVDINRTAGSRANVTWSCTKDGTDFAVGITNSDLDVSPKTNSFPLETKIDNNPVSTVNVTPDTSKRFVLSKHLDPRTMFAGDIANIYKTNYLYVGFPVNGDDVVLRINLHESGVSRFLGLCLTSLQTHGDRKQFLADMKPIQSDAKPAVAPEPQPAQADPKPVKAETAPVVNEVKQSVAAIEPAVPVQPASKPSTDVKPVVTAEAPQARSQSLVQPEAKQIQAEIQAEAQPPVAEVKPVAPPPVVEAQPSQADVKASQVDMAIVPPPEAAPPAKPKPQTMAVESARARAKRKAERWTELARYNLGAGEQITLRKEYSPGAAPIRIGALYKKIPTEDNDRARYMIGQVTLGGGELANKNSLTIVDVHKDADGLDDWYYIKVNCPACTYDAATSAPSDGWVAASDVTAWRDDPLCVSGTKGCN